MKHKSISVNSSGFSDAQLPMLKLKEIKILLKSGQISFDEAKTRAEEPLKELNERMAKISKKYGRKPREIGFVSIMR